MDSVNDPMVEDIVIMSSAQVGKTELLLNIIGYYIDYDPAPMLVEHLHSIGTSAKQTRPHS